MAARLCCYGACSALLVRPAPSLHRHLHCRRDLTLQHAAPSRSIRTSRRYAATSSMTQPVIDTVHKIIDTKRQTVLYVTGGAATAVPWLLQQPGASSTILDVRVPYSTGALTELLGFTPSQFASKDVAVAMARSAYRQAVQLSAPGQPVVGVGATCALRTNREKKGDHKVYVASFCGRTLRTYSITLSKGARTRAEEDALASMVVLQALATASEVPSTRLVDEALLEGEHVGVEETVMSTPLHELLNGRVDCVEYSGGHVYVDAPRGGMVYLPGSFNPLHQGHRELLEAATESTGRPGIYELSIGNADKGFLPEEEIMRRVRQFEEAGLPVVVTQAPLFTQKAELFPNSVFAVGYDTAVRLVKPEYYGDETAMLLQFAKLVYRGCSFLVGGRVDEGGRFCTLKDVAIPEDLQRGGLFRGIDESLFRKDLSSTELRSSGKGLTPAT